MELVAGMEGYTDGLALLDRPPESEGWDCIHEALRARAGKFDSPEFLAGWLEGYAHGRGWKLVRA